MKRNMFPLIAMILGMGVVYYGIFDSGGSTIMFISIPSLFIVLGGSFAALAIVYPLKELKKIPKIFKVLLSQSTYNLPDLVLLFEELARKARKEGILSLESSLEEIEDGFLRKGLQLVIDGSEADEIKQILNTEIEALELRHMRNQELFTKWGVLAPGFGMIGTVIGLVIMLGNLSTDPTELGAGMATALITTFYGSLFANLLFEPMAANLSFKTEDEVMFRNIMMQGITMIQSGSNPRVVKEILMTHLSPDEKLEVLDLQDEIRS